MLRNRLDEAPVVRGIAEDLAQFRNGGIQEIVEIDEHLAGPQAVMQLLSRDDLAGPLDQRGQDAEGLIAKNQPLAALEILPSGKIDLVGVEADDSCHGRS